MHTQRLSVENRRSSRDVTLGRAAICFVGSLLAIFSAQDGLGQGFKVTQLNNFQHSKSVSVWREFERGNGRELRKFVVRYVGFPV
jgi:hypothetical protein